MTTEDLQHAATSDHEDAIDVLVIGAGVAGVEQLYELRSRGLDALVVDAAGGIGGTWWWNRYPGCRFDSESYSYGYFFDRQLYADWSWSEHYAGQPETERYLNHVVDRYGLRPFIRLNTRVARMEFDDEENVWRTTTTAGDTITSRFVVTGIGRLSQPQYPATPGRETFRGIQHHTGLWPAEPVDFAGKRVAVVGVGSSGVQIAPHIAAVAEHLTVFQSTPNWCAPLRNSPITDEEQTKIKASFDEIHDACVSTAAGFIHRFQTGTAQDLTPEERRAFYEELWQRPGFAKMFSNYPQVVGVREFNDEFSAFVADKIRERVKDPVVAEMLIPKDHGYGQKRPPHEEGFYEIFNQPNVKLIDVKATPMLEITPTGITTTEAHVELDIIVYATGYDALTGAFDQIDIRAGGRSLKEAWAEGPQTQMGLATPGFPNMFYIGGPQSGGGNAPRCIEPQVEFLARLIADATSRGFDRVEATEAAAEAWTEHVNSTVAGTLGAVAKKDWSWGSNTPGKKVVYRSYAAGLPTYLAKLKDVEDNGWAGFELSAAEQTAPVVTAGA